ncbi:MULTISPECIES: GH25 family lysozyme [Clostridium]|uniref:GH25 family lysozyme n=1 Tax=Clostridium TaxID=1485 RepID=UPI0009BFD391|nr:hypothetical protein CUB90_02380 [Clostridium sp. CT7]
MKRHKILSLALTVLIMLPSFAFSNGQAVKAEEITASNTGVNSSATTNISAEKSTTQVNNSIPFRDANGKIIGYTLTNGTSAQSNNTTTGKHLLGASDQTMQGIDVYSGTDVTDWNAVKNAGVTAVYIKLTEGLTYNNPKAQEQYNGAKSAGLKVGAYHFGRSNSADSEYAHFAAEASKYKWDLKPVLDYEPDQNPDYNYISQFMSKNPNLVFYSFHSIADNTGLPLNKIWIAEPIDAQGSKYVYTGTTKGYAGIQYLWYGNMTGLNGDVDKDIFSYDVLASPALQSLLSIDSPTSNGAVSDSVNVTGWSLSNFGTKQITVSLDGQGVGNATLKQARSDIEAKYPEYNDANSGFSYTLDLSNTTYGNHTITVTALEYDGTTISQSVNVVKNDTTISQAALGVSYKTHVQNFGWLASVMNGAEAGTSGQGLRMEALNINLVNAPADAHIQYQAHVQNIGWQDWVSDGQEVGTDGKGFRVEAMKIKLQNMPGYSIQYRAYVQNIGWQDWVSDGQEAGTNGQGLRVEKLQIRLVKISDNSTVGVSYQGHVQNVGWQDPVENGQIAGTEGQDLRVEALKINLKNAPANAHIKYQSHVQNIGWQNWVSDGTEVGTDGKGLRVEAIKLQLENMPGYSVQYRAHVQNIGWQDWVSDGQEAGTDGKGLRVEAIEIRIVKTANN